MGIFSSKGICPVCGAEIGALSYTKVADGYICFDCGQKCSPLLNFSIMPKEHVAEHIKKRQRDAELFPTLTPTASVGKYFVVFGNERLWACMINKKKTPDLFSFDDIINYEYLEDGTTITKGGLGTAAVGGLLFGGVGAIVGGNWGKKQKGVINKISIRISTKVVDIPNIEIVLLTEEAQKGGFLATSSKKEAMDILSLLDQTTQSTAPQTETNPSFSAADEIMKFKNLLDAGIITQEEFDEKKKQLLNI